MNQQHYDALVIGQGPAGCSAALYLCRAGLCVAVVGKRDSALHGAEKIENYYGLAQPLSGLALSDIGRGQCRTLGAELLEDEVLSLDWLEDGHFTAALASGTVLQAPAALLATGKAKTAPAIEGLPGLVGKGVSYCAVCDGFLYRGRSVAVLGGGAYAKHEMEALLPLAGKVTLLTHGAEPEFALPETVTLFREPLLRLQGEDTLQTAVLSDGSELPLNGLFVAMGSASAGDLAVKLGIRLEKNAIPVNAKQETALPGLYAAGDCTGSFAQIAFAVAEGAKAALAMTPYIRKAKHQRQPA
ncbi:MAG: NAD(P)/FAD-dependent oxidoreductase [Oscillospiraceae bacterium]|jgi:thioredoxin reductase (NADPH)|nr:NAD(P)/FAD-dependent oxidoreductase [Oscillospiraceae bacterium]